MGVKYNGTPKEPAVYVALQIIRARLRQPNYIHTLDENIGVHIYTVTE